MKRQESESARIARENAIKAKQAITKIETPRLQEGFALPMMLSAAIPFWIHEFRHLTLEEWHEKINHLNSDASDFCLRMEYVLHKGPKEGDSARAFNDLAKSIALLSFCPGGVTSFNQHWESKFDNTTTDAGSQD